MIWRTNKDGHHCIGFNCDDNDAVGDNDDGADECDDDDVRCDDDADVNEGLQEPASGELDDALPRET